jgi:two-component system cell cycle sensor histidine kinase/response regulator CckA
VTNRTNQLGNADLRRKAEAIAQTTGADSSEHVDPLSAEEARQTLHELRVHQIELEMQNEELRRAQVALDAARARYFDLYDVAPVGYVTVSQTGLLLEANLTAATLLGVPRNELANHPLSQYILKEDQDTWYLHHNQLLENGDSTSYELRMVKQDRTAFWAHLQASYAQESDSAPVCRVVLTDVTERKQAEADKEAIQTQVLQFQKMQAVGELAGGVAHDFNNMLTGILGNIDIIRTGLPATDPLTANLLAVESAARQAADLTRGLLAFSRNAVVVRTPICINDAIDTALVMLQQSLPATIAIVRHFAQPAWTVMADQTQMTQVLLNLGINARDAMEGRGTLTVSTQNSLVGAAYVREHPFARQGEFVHLSVADTGPGILPELLPHIFEPFFTTKDVGIGTGLGLPIVYGAVNQAGGWVTAQSNPGEGALFEVYLPRCADRQVHVVATAPAADGPRAGTVLVVEDEPVVSDVTQALLSRNGYKVLTASDGASALRTLQEHADTIDLVLLDMTMPGMTTEEIVSAIRSTDSRVAILLTSGYTSGETVNRMLKEGTVQGFMAKPYDLREMLDNVEKLLHR